jgi:hypothetical protein
MRVKLGRGNVGFVASRLTIPTASGMAREVPKHHTCKSLRIKGDDRQETQGKTIDADHMRASSRFRATLQIGLLAASFHLMKPNHQETGSELIQAIALEGQNCHGKKRDTDQHRQFHSSFS